MTNMDNDMYRNEGGRVPPQAVEVEESVVGAMLIERESVDIALQSLKKEDFYRPANRHVFEVIHDLDREGRDPNLITVENELRDRSLLSVVGGSGYLADLTRSVSSAAHIDDHAKIIKEKSVKRNLITSCTDIIKFCYENTTDAAEAIEKATTMLDDITGDMFKNEGQFVKDLLEGVMDDILHRRDVKGLTGIATGLAIDKYTGGWQPGDLYIVAARPSIGKSALAINASFNSVLFEGIKSIGYYANIEMKNYDLIKRRLAFESEVNYLKMRDGKVTDTDVERILSAANKLYKGRLILDDSPSPNINEFRAKYKTAVRVHGVEFGMIDYLQLMSGNKEGTREQEISSISRGLKALAKETNTPIIALSQLSRECERRQGAEPYLSDLRESGSLEQDADGVILLNRPEFFKHGTFDGKPTEGKGWVKVAKMRNGMTGEFTMNFNKTYAMWENEYGQYEKFQEAQQLDDEEREGSATQPHSIPDDIDDEPKF